MHDRKPSETSAEQLLKLLDAQLADSRKRREEIAAKRGTFRIVAILVILLGAALALGALMHLLNDMRPAGAGRAPVGESR